MPFDLRLDLLTHLAVAALLGGLVGLEREASGKPAGLRTNILICVGAALLTDLSLALGARFGTEVPADPTRIAAQIVSGIGFLGAGTILQARGAVYGLTTAATLWVVAAIGMAVGSGNQVEAVGGTVLVLAILLPLGHLERWVERRRRTRRMILRIERDEGVLQRLLEAIEGEGLDVRERRLELRDGLLTATLQVSGSATSFERSREHLLGRPELRGLEVK
jgi:putative Mg2+ transporter-C (MgtC) family protein